MEPISPLAGIMGPFTAVEVLLLIVGAGLLYLMTLSVWMYFDSKSRGASNPWKWAIGPWADGWLAPFIYLEERKRFGTKQDEEADGESDSERD